MCAVMDMFNTLHAFHNIKNPVFLLSRSYAIKAMIESSRRCITHFCHFVNYFEILMRYFARKIKLWLNKHVYGTVAQRVLVNIRVLIILETCHTKCVTQMITDAFLFVFNIPIKNITLLIKFPAFLPKMRCIDIHVPHGLL